MADILLDEVAAASLGAVPAGAVDLYADSTAHGLKLKKSDGTFVNTFGRDTNPWLDVKSFGAVGDGATDDTAAIQSAITAAVTGFNGRSGAKVYFPSGVYKVSSTLTFGAGANNIALVGADRGSSVILPATAFASGDVIQLLSGSAFITIMELGIIAQGTRTANAMINTNGANDVVIHNVQITGGFVGIAVQGSSIKVHITNTEVNSTIAATGVGILVNNGSAGDTYIGPNVIMSNGGAPLAGIQILATGHTSILQANVTKAITGLLVNPGAAAVVNYLFVSHSLFDSCTTNCINLNATTATSTIASCKFVNSWASGTTAGGGAGIILQGTGAGVLNGIHFLGCRILNNQTHGVSLNFGVNIRFTESTIAGNSQASSGVSNGIDVAANVSNFSICDNKIGTSGTSTTAIQKFGINIAAGTSNNFIITGNDLTGQVTATAAGGINDASAPTGLVQKIVQDNIGGLIQGGLSCTTAASAAINTTATVVAGGANSGAVVPANTLRVGSVIRIGLSALNTSTVANAQTWTVRFGVNGTTADASIATGAVTSAAAGTAIPFKVIFEFVVTAIGATGQIQGNLTLLNTGITGAAVNNVTVVLLTTTATLNTTVTSYLTVSFASAATTTTNTFQPGCMIEVVRT